MVVPGYRPIARLSGEGGPTEVWSAVRIADGEGVALKLLAISASPDRRIRFEAEGRLLSTLGGHHHLVRCDAVLDSPPAMVLELADQGSLRDRLAAGGPLPVRLALGCVRQIGAAIDWLHHHGVTHRDVKPSNILLAGDGTWRLIDLGVAASGDPPRSLPPGWIEEATGTLGYTAPELLREPSLATPAIDGYGLGVVLYEALSGRLPIEMTATETEDAYRNRVMAGPTPTPLAAWGDYPPTLTRLVMRAIDADPERRFPSLSQMLEDLGQFG